MPDSHTAGWGNLPTANAEVKTPATENGLSEQTSSGSEFISRGLGRAYGDAALPSKEGGVVISGLGLKRFLSFDESTGILVAESGVSLAEIIKVFLPRGWFLPTVPGTKFVTLGGAVAADIHGKNHHIDGTFGVHVAWLDLVTANGATLNCSLLQNNDIFKATIGGMGLTGHIIRVAIRLRRVPSAYCKVRYIKSKNLTHTLSLLSEHDVNYRHTVAWMDCLASGEKLGRGVLMLGNEAEVTDLSKSQLRMGPHHLPNRPEISVPFNLPSWFLGNTFVKVFNFLYYGLAKDAVKIVDYENFFFPLDTIKHWNRIYGRRGFVQFQAYFPDATAEKGLQECLEAISRAGLASFLAVLKRSGKANEFPLSFLDKGYTLALDIPGDPQKLPSLMNELDSILSKYNGRIYFAKDAMVNPDLIATMYPKLEEFKRVKTLVDPKGVIQSRLSRRLHLHD
jgi:decaprenylphospho-beta-D-ribofuranose 2-oxidase